MIVFKITIEVKDARIEKQARKIDPKDVVESFRRNSRQWLYMKNTKVKVKFEKVTSLRKNSRTKNKTAE